MPYYVYQIHPGVTALVKHLDLQEEFGAFKDAKTFVKAARKEQDTEDKATYKIIFAENILEAEERLQEHREPPALQEWEK